jgi:CheY-like chemotaxis protein
VRLLSKICFIQAGRVYHAREKVVKDLNGLFTKPGTQTGLLQRQIKWRNQDMSMEMVKEMNSVLIISRDEEMIAVWETLYQQKNCLVMSESSGWDALQSARLLSPALIVLDLDLPKQERIRLCQKLRSTTSGTLVLLAPREQDGEIFDEYYHAGVDEHLVTPISPMALLIKSMAWLVRQDCMTPRAKFHA